MRVVALTEKVLGQVLAMPIHGDGGRLMVARGMRLTSSILRALRRRGYTRVAIEDPLLRDIQPDQAIQEETRQQAIEALDEARRKILSNSPVCPHAMKEAVEGIIHDMKRNPKACIGLYSLCSYDQETYTHSINVCILSIAAAEALSWSPKDLQTLGLGAILHDIGKILIPASTLNKPSGLSDEEYALVKTHALKGWELLSSCYDIGPVAAHAALDHHERLDGSGYPRRLTELDISPIGRITAVADVYEAMTSDRPQRGALLPEIAYAFISENSGRQFDRNVTQALFSRVALYPAGTILSLWGGYVAVVVRQDRRSNRRPFVRIVSGPGITKPVDTALHERPDLQVTLVLDDYPPETRRMLAEGPRAASKDN